MNESLNETHFDSSDVTGLHISYIVTTIKDYLYNGGKYVSLSN